MHRLLQCITVSILCGTGLASSQDIPGDTLPDSFAGIAVRCGLDADNNWKRMSRSTFKIGTDWEEIILEIDHGGSLGHTLSGYTFSSPEESFRYDAFNGIKSINLFDDGVIDRSKFLSPRLGYEMLARSDSAPTETLDDGTRVFYRSDPMNGPDMYIAVEPEHGRIVWMESRYPDGVSRERFEYHDWTPLGDTGAAYPREILYSQSTDPLMGSKTVIEQAELLANDTPPQPESIGDHYTLYDYGTMTTYDSKGNKLGKVLTQLPDPNAGAGAWKRNAFIIVGLALILGSGVLILKRRAAA